MTSLRLVADPTSPFSPERVLEAVARPRDPVHVVADDQGRRGVSFEAAPGLVGTLPGLYPEWLGDRRFLATHRLRFPYVAGAMANGIATVEVVVAMARAGMLGFFGAAGLPRARVEEALDRIAEALDGTGLSWGANLIHSPNEPSLEEGVADLYLRRGVRRVSASAYMGLTRAIVRYAATGLTEDANGQVHRANHVFAKVSRPEVARHFLSPAPATLLEALVARGELTGAEARLASRVPVAEDLTVEADSGGHTDNRPLGALFPVIAALRDELVKSHGYTRPVRVGAAGGLGTPAAVASAFALGAAYVLTGSVNQGAVESGLSPAGKAALAEAGVADVTMAPAADMFEQGVRLQVLQRGSMFAARAGWLYEAYRAHASLDDLPPEVRERLERQVFQRPIAEVWDETLRFWRSRDPAEAERAERDPRHRMALVFRWYLGLSSRWAIAGDAARKLDYQIWCGPAMGAFNGWARGSFLESPASRGVVQIALNLLEGAATVTRAQQLRTFGVDVPEAAFDYRPRRLR